MARPMSPTGALYRVHDAGGNFLMGEPLAEALIGPGYQATPWGGDGPTLYAVPGRDGGYEWADWATASERGWCERDGRRVHEGEGQERRFLVLYYPAPVRAWPFLWRLAKRRPRRVDVCRGPIEAEWLAGREIARRQPGFQAPGWTAVVAVWGWDDRVIGWHAECRRCCGCDGPRRARDYVLVVEFESEAAALRPDVHLERSAWMAGLDAARARAIVADPDATQDEVEAARSWLASHRPEPGAWW